MKILCVTETLSSGGREKFAINILKNIDRDKYHIDFFVISNDEQMYTEEARMLGAKIFSSNTGGVESGIRNFVKKCVILAQICRDGKYDIIHIYGDTHLDYMKVMMIYTMSYSKIIMHVHGATPLKRFDKRFAGKMLKYICEKHTDYNIACSIEAAKYMYSKKVYCEIIHNPYNVCVYKFNQVYRNEIRKLYDIQEMDFLIGHVGRFSPEKNHVFMLKTFKSFLNVYQNARLLLVGEGLLVKECKKIAKEFEISDRVIFAGTTNEVYKYYSAFDILWFPSVKESLGMCVIEAQTSGTPVIISPGVPEETILNKNVQVCELEEKSWIDLTLTMSRCETNLRLFDSYEINGITNRISNIYDQLCKGRY